MFNIQRFSIHDGPGIRTTVFLKGCNLSCFWCHNPESIRPQKQVQFFPQKCIGCGNCFEACPVHAHIMKDEQHVYDRSLCERCGKCVDLCYANALEMAGELKTVNEVLDVVERDRPFYDNSGGGMTLSGGEPLLPLSFSKALLEEGRQRGFHNAVDTAGNVSWDCFEEVLPLVDLFLYDLKHIDADRHREATGVENQRLLQNLSRLSETDKEVWVRIPLIPGFNDSPEVISAMADLLAGLPDLSRVELLPFHRLGEGKYASLGESYPAADLPAPTEEQVKALRSILVDRKLPVP